MEQSAKISGQQLQSGALEAKQKLSDVGDDWKVAIQTSSQDFINAGVSIKKNAQEAGI